jgi:hypothetical protein
MSTVSLLLFRAALLLCSYWVLFQVVDTPAIHLYVRLSKEEDDESLARPLAAQ